nr:hypothetical protein [Gammaproteobacteria bacterium]
QNWLMCDVTQPGRLKYLKHAVKMGGDVNRIKTGISQSYSAPLMCAISYGNKAAFDFLLANGANPNIVVCRSCEPKYRRSPMSEALFSDEYKMAFELIPVTNVTEEELEVARLVLEDSRYWPKPEESQEEYRQKIAAYLESKGYELNIWSLEKENAGEWFPTYLRQK